MSLHYNFHTIITPYIYHADAESKSPPCQQNSIPTMPMTPGNLLSHHQTGPHLKSALVSACTTEVPSTNRVRKMRLAFVNIPSFRLTTMN